MQLYAHQKIQLAAVGGLKGFDDDVRDTPPCLVHSFIHLNPYFRGADVAAGTASYDGGV